MGSARWGSQAADQLARDARWRTPRCVSFLMLTVNFDIFASLAKEETTFPVGSPLNISAPVLLKPGSEPSSAQDEEQRKRRQRQKEEEAKETAFFKCDPRALPSVSLPLSLTLSPHFFFDPLGAPSPS